jgi:HAD superfamily hydrolase (TIGR01509 family)
MTQIRGVVLDIDGTLVDSNDAHAHAWVEALAESGIQVPFAAVRRLIGMGGDKLLPKVSDIVPDSSEGQAILKRRLQIFTARYLPSLRPFPGVRDLLKHLRKMGLRLAVASSAKRAELDALLKICGAVEFIEDKTSSDDADRSKPDPDIVKAALQKLDLPPANVLMLGDTPYDIESAGRTGVSVIAFRCGGWSDADLARAVAIYDNPADLLAHYDASPLVSETKGRT